jgi:thiol-disulfide isomerase/thioredoxin
MVYIKDIFKYPDYWEKHLQVFISNDINNELEKEKNNPYKYVLAKTLKSFYASQKDKVAYDFSASQLDGANVKLSDFKSKMVVIDAWATWCGPCLRQRPTFLALAEKYQSNNQIQFLMVSVDENIIKWEKYVTKSTQLKSGVELNMKNGMQVFREQYFIPTIPRYILIGQDGLIINANLPGPSEGLAEVIEQNLSQI